jgi:hypothetical protein
VSPDDFEVDKLDIKNDLLKKVPKEVLKMRMDLLVKFSKIFMKANKVIQFSDKVEPGSLEHNFLKCKSLVFSSAKDKILDKFLEDMGSGD